MGAWNRFVVLLQVDLSGSSEVHAASGMPEEFALRVDNRNEGLSTHAAG